MSNQLRGKLILPLAVGQRIKLSEWSFGTGKQQESGFIENAYFNGLGRTVCQLQRLTLKFNKTSGTSRGVRDYIESDLVDFARSHPGIALYLVPRRKPTPVLSAEYLNGTMHWFNLRNFNQQQTKEWIEYFVSRSGTRVQRIRKPVRTAVPSIQGHWTPFLNLPGRLNVTTFPDAERGAFVPTKLSATEQLLRLQDDIRDSHILREEKDE